MRSFFLKGFIMYFSVWMIVIGFLPADGMAMRIPSDATMSESVSLCEMPTSSKSKQNWNQNLWLND